MTSCSLDSCVWLLSLSIMILRFTYIVVSVVHSSSSSVVIFFSSILYCGYSTVCLSLPVDEKLFFVFFPAWGY